MATATQSWQQTAIEEMKQARNWWTKRLADGDVLNRLQVAQHITAINESIVRLQRGLTE